MANFFRKFLPEATVQRVRIYQIADCTMYFHNRCIKLLQCHQLRQAFLFRPEDPNNLHQVLPPKVVNTTVERIKGNRWPSPGSRLGASVPTRESEDEIYNTNFYPKDSRNLKKDVSLGSLFSVTVRLSDILKLILVLCTFSFSLQNAMFINSGKNPVLISTDPARMDSHGKRKITLLPYDASGLRTTKTTTWGAVAPVLDATAPNHLPMPDWWSERDEIDKVRESKGLPPAVGRRYQDQTTANYNEVRW